MKRVIKDNCDSSKEYELKKDWPEDCFIQGGSDGIVFTNKEENPVYNTFFVEAFPKNPKCFIRGEGNNFEEAEEKAYNQLVKFISCNNHNFVKAKGYKNGMGVCVNCGLMQEVFEPEYTCVVCGKHDHYAGIINKSSEIDCICEECASKRENVKYISTFSLKTMAKMFNGSMFENCVISKDTFDKLKDKPETEIKFFEILDSDENIYISEYMQRLKIENPNNRIKTNDYDGLYNYFYNNFLKKWIDKEFNK